MCINKNSNIYVLVEQTTYQQVEGILQLTVCCWNGQWRNIHDHTGCSVELSSFWPSNDAWFSCDTFSNKTGFGMPLWLHTALKIWTSLYWISWFVAPCTKKTRKTQFGSSEEWMGFFHHISITQPTRWLGWSESHTFATKDMVWPLYISLPQLTLVLDVFRISPHSRPSSKLSRWISWLMVGWWICSPWGRSPAYNFPKQMAKPFTSWKYRIY